MPYVKSVVPTGDAYSDGLMSGRAWNAAALTFSFPASASFYGSGYGDGEPQNGFQAFNAEQQSAARSILSHYASVIDLDFGEVTESSDVHGDLRFAETSLASTAWGYYPSREPEGGDTWYSASGTYDAPRPGTYAWLTIVHEIGHALGLKHPHESSGSFGPLPADRDSLEYTVMSYRSDVGAATDYYRNGSSSYPQTLMMLDIAALQRMYGANYATNAGDTVYRWSPTSGQLFIDGVGQAAPAGNKIFMTVWDGGGTDTYDFSAYAGALFVDLAPGAWSTVSAAQLADLGRGAVAVGNIANALLYDGNPASLIENVIGGNGSDVIAGNEAANVLTGGRGDDRLDGRDGIDTAVFGGRAADYAITENGDGSWTVTDLRLGRPDGTDTLWNVESMQFSDALVAAAPGQTPPGTSVTTDDATDTTTDVADARNTAPVAAKDIYFVQKNKTLKIAASGPLANDRDADGDPLEAVLVSGPNKGKLALSPDGAFVYKTKKGFTGKVKFKYEADDGIDTSAAAKVVIKVKTKKALDKAGLLAAATGDDGLDFHPIPAATTDYHAPGTGIADAFAVDAGASSPFSSGPDWLHHRVGFGPDLYA